MAKHRINIQVLGELHLLPPAVERAARQVMKATQHYDGVTLNICLAYSYAPCHPFEAPHAARVASVSFTQQLSRAFLLPALLCSRTSSCCFSLTNACGIMHLYHEGGLTMQRVVI